MIGLMERNNYDFNRYLSSRASLAKPGDFYQSSSSSSSPFSICHALCRRRHGNYLIRCYILTKLLYVINIVIQLFILDVFLGTPFHVYGVEVLRGVLLRGSPSRDGNGLVG